MVSDRGPVCQPRSFTGRWLAASRVPALRRSCGCCGAGLAGKIYQTKIPSPVTCCRSHRDWTEQGLLEEAWRLLLRKLDERVRLKLDETFANAPAGRAARSVGPAPIVARNNVSRTAISGTEKPAAATPIAPRSTQRSVVNTARASRGGGKEASATPVNPAKSVSCSKVMTQSLCCGRPFQKPANPWRPETTGSQTKTAFDAPRAEETAAPGEIFQNNPPQPTRSERGINGQKLRSRCR
jgi:hypothetical protein